MITTLLLVAALAQAPPKPALLLISIDGLRPDTVLEADKYHLKIPHLRKILHDGARARGVRGVLPTVTYPSHTTILTGVWPAKHGIYSNVSFDPLDENLAGWKWYAEDIQSPTLWDTGRQSRHGCGKRLMARKRGCARCSLSGSGILARTEVRRRSKAAARIEYAARNDGGDRENGGRLRQQSG